MEKAWRKGKDALRGLYGSLCSGPGVMHLPQPKLTEIVHPPAREDLSPVSLLLVSPDLSDLTVYLWGAMEASFNLLSLREVVAEGA